jgi:hypothetical protein
LKFVLVGVVGVPSSHLTTFLQPKPREKVIETTLRYMHTDTACCRYEPGTLAERQAQVRHTQPNIGLGALPPLSHVHARAHTHTYIHSLIAQVSMVPKATHY